MQKPAGSWWLPWTVDVSQEVLFPVVHVALFSFSTKVSILWLHNEYFSLSTGKNHFKPVPWFVLANQEFCVRSQLHSKFTEFIWKRASKLTTMLVIDIQEFPLVTRFHITCKLILWVARWANFNLGRGNCGMILGRSFNFQTALFSQPTKN